VKRVPVRTRQLLERGLSLQKQRDEVGHGHCAEFDELRLRGSL
jgi:hypothetical protein